MGTIRVGVSGWDYPAWRGAFYPPGLPRRRELEYLARRLPTVEINASFYALQRPSRYQAWADRTPDDFLFAVKGSRYITHLLRLRRVEPALANFFASGVLALGHRLGPILWQLPPQRRFDRDQVADFLALLPRTTAQATVLAARHDARLAGRAWVTTDADRTLRHVLEVRHSSFADPAALDLLRQFGIGLVVADTGGRFPFLDEVTSDLVYVRLHGQTELYVTGYDDPALDRWADRVLAWADSGVDVLVYFDNDAQAHAPFDAQRLGRRLARDPYPRDMTSEAFEPDTKDWTWVLERRCPDCGFDAREESVAELARTVTATVSAWQSVLGRPDVRQRPCPTVWSPLEYACHVRDVYRVFTERLAQMLDQDDPQFASWDQDETAVAEHYAEQDPAQVFDELTAAGQALAELISSVPHRGPNAWLRPGRRSGGAVFTVESICRYLLHDVVHHLHDVGRPLT